MDTHEVNMTEVFAELGRRLDGFGRDERTRAVIDKAHAANGWFMPDDIRMAVEAICADMLRQEALEKWTGAYAPVKERRSVAVIMAGNIPLVGFFDMMCVLVSGHRCYIKPSSKDSVLIEYVASLLREIHPAIPLHAFDGQDVDAVIATGSDNTNRYFRSRFGSLPSILRGSRSSVAILTGRETDEELDCLARDIFSYNGLGCRNVSHLFVPNGYDIDRLAARLSTYAPINPKYVNNFRQRSAILRMQGEKITEATFFLLCESGQLPASISEITYTRYSAKEEVTEWLAVNDSQLQCVVHDPALTGITHRRSAAFGQGQRPTLFDYPDDEDVMAFLRGI